MDRIITPLRALLPTPILNKIRPVYHFSLALWGAFRYAYPSNHLTVIGITGTKGKTSTAEILGSILEHAGFKVAILGTLHFKIGDKDERNLKKMTMPGRLFVQRFLRQAVDAGCTHAIIEMTSEGAKQFRHRFIAMDALIYTNLAPEHIESHGSFAKYREAKLSIAKALVKSPKLRKWLIVNADDENSGYFLKCADGSVTNVPYQLKDATPYTTKDSGVIFTFLGHTVTSPLPGTFNIMNILGAATLAKRLGISPKLITEGIEKCTLIPGRMERIDLGQEFPVIIDYAHTPDSLLSAYNVFPEREIIAVLGNTGGGRDTWKRPVMGSIADEHCAHIILTNEDPYDEDPYTILEEMSAGISKTPHHIELDRRQAIHQALSIAQHESRPSVVIITGKGTDPYIMGPNGTKQEWDDRTVATEELAKILAKK